MARANSCGNVMAESDNSRSARAAPTGGQAVVAADQKDQVAALHFGIGDEFGEGGGIERLARRVEKILRAVGCLRPEIGAIGPDFAHFAGAVAGGAAQKILGDGVGVRVFRFADEVKEDLHSGGISTRLGAAPEPLQTVILARLWARKCGPAGRHNRPAPIRPGCILPRCSAIRRAWCLSCSPTSSLMACTCR